MAQAKEGPQRQWVSQGPLSQGQLKCQDFDSPFPPDGTSPTVARGASRSCEAARCCARATKLSKRKGSGGLSIRPSRAPRPVTVP